MGQDTQIKIGLFIVGCICAAFGALVAFWWFAPYEDGIIELEPAYASTEAARGRPDLHHVKAGGTVWIHRRTRVAEAANSRTATRKLLSLCTGQEYYLDTRVQMGWGENNRSFAVEIPSGIPPCQYHYMVVMTYYVNPLRIRHVALDPVTLEVDK